MSADLLLQLDRVVRLPLVRLVGALGKRENLGSEAPFIGPVHDAHGARLAHTIAVAAHRDAVDLDVCVDLARAIEDAIYYVLVAHHSVAELRELNTERAKGAFARVRWHLEASEVAE